MKFLSDVEDDRKDGKIWIEWQESYGGRWTQLLSKEEGEKTLKEYNEYMDAPENQELIHAQMILDKIIMIKIMREFLDYNGTSWDKKCSDWLQEYEDRNEAPSWANWTEFYRTNINHSHYIVDKTTYI